MHKTKKPHHIFYKTRKGKAKLISLCKSCSFQNDLGDFFSLPVSQRGKKHLFSLFFSSSWRIFSRTTYNGSSELSLLETWASIWKLKYGSLDEKWWDTFSVINAAEEIRPAKCFMSQKQCEVNKRITMIKAGGTSSDINIFNEATVLFSEIAVRGILLMNVADCFVRRRSISCTIALTPSN